MADPIALDRSAETWEVAEALDQLATDRGTHRQRAAQAQAYFAELEGNDRDLPVAPLGEVGRLWRTQLRGSVGLVVLLIVFTVVAAVATQTLPRLLGSLVSSAESMPTDGVRGLLLLIVGVVGLQAIFTYLAARWEVIVGQRMTAKLREKAVRDALSLPLGRIERASSGDLTTRLTQDSNVVGDTLRNDVPQVLLAAITSITILLGMVLNSPLLTVPTLLGLPLIVWASRRFLRRAPAAYLYAGSVDSRLNASVLETVDCVRLVRTLRLENARLDDLLVSEAQRYTLGLRLRLFFALEVAYNWPLVPTLLLGVFARSQGWIDIGTLTTAVLYSLSWPAPVNRLVQTLGGVLTGVVSAARVTGLDLRDRDAEAQHSMPPRGTDRGTDLRCDEVAFSYDGGHDVLDQLDLTIPAGESVAVVGASGSGKSTLARLLSGIAAPGRGSVTLGGVEVSTIPLPELRAKVALVTQEHHVFTGSLRDNIGLSRQQLTDSDIVAALQAVGAGPWLACLQEGLDTQLGVDGLSLSPARAQQIAIARILAADPPVMILDEATSLLDPTTALAVERSVAGDRRTVLAIVHRLDIAETADRVVVMDGGRIVESGPPNRLRDSAGVYAQLWSTWAGQTPGSGENRPTQGRTASTTCRSDGAEGESSDRLGWLTGFTSRCLDGDVLIPSRRDPTQTRRELTRGTES